jgi:hypothetical protein
MTAQAASRWMELTAAALFGLAVLHTFSTKYFQHLAHRHPPHAGVWHLLGEVEVVFGLWAFVLIVLMSAAQGWGAAVGYLERSRFVEPMFVFVIMVISASRPILQLLADLVRRLASVMPLSPPLAYYFLGLALVPLLGSFVTEPAAMTLAALMLRDVIFATSASRALKYATLGVLFVNVSIGGTLTHFAAPPVLMVAATWGWDTAFVFSTFGWKAAIAVVLNASLLTLLFRAELRSKAQTAARANKRVPAAFVLINLAILAGVVASSHHPAVFMGLFLFFLGLSEAYRRYHDKLMLREGLMVAFFLAGLVVLGGQQTWWLQSVLTNLSETSLFYGAAALTAITDNAALTYLGSLVPGVSEEFKYALVSGAVVGGGLTVIANAPNPAGFAILKDSFDEGSINPLWLFLGALPPTLIAVFCFRGLSG